MAETYIPYGEEQIEYAPLVKNMADDVVNYVDQQPWSAKRKNRFMEAYSDIVSNGIIGADNKSGQWAVNLRGNIDTNSMSKKDRDIYQEAAYYILQKMKGAPIKKDTEKEDKKNLQLYDNDWHQKAITGYIGNNMFGGQNWDYTTQWDTLDKRDEKTGLLGTSNRMTKLADMLEGYGKSLEEGKYNFEGTAFKDLNDLKSRINDAVTALRGGVLDQNVINALNRVGIDYRTYLHDGSDEQITLQNGTTVTRGQYLKALQEQEAAANQQKLLEQKQQDIAKQKASLGVLDLVSGVHAVEAKTNPDEYSNWLAQTHGVGEKGFNAINQRVQTLLNKGKGLTSKDKKELGNLLYYIRANNPNYQKSNITDQEWAELNIHKNLGSNNRAGFVRLPWQSNGRYTFADDKGNVYFLKPQKHQKLAAPIQRSNISNYRKNFLTKTNTDAANLEWLKQQGFNDADLAELGGIVLDIASIVNPEPFSAGALGVLAAGARNYARASQPKKWGIEDYLAQGVDYGLGALGFIPGAGDALLAGKTVKNIAKIGKRLLTIPAVMDMAVHTPGAYDALKKAINGESLTVGDWKNLGSFFRGLAGTRNITVQNRAARRVLEKKGYDLSDQNSWLKKSGLLDTSVPKTQTAVKVKVNDKSVEIPLSGKSKEELDIKLRKAGNDQAAKDKAIRETPEVVSYKEKNKIKSEDISAVESSSFRNTKLFGNRIGILPKQLRTTKENYSQQSITKPTGQDTFKQYLESDRGIWDKFKYGSNRTLRGAERYINSFGINESSSKSNSTSTPSNENTDNPPINRQRLNELREKFGRSKVEKSNPKQEYNQKQQHRAEKEIDLFLKSYGEKNSSGRSSFIGGYGSSTNKIKPGEYSFDLGNGKTIKFSITKEEVSKVPIGELRNRIQKQIKESVLNKTDAVTVGNILRKLKRQGFLKRGGTIQKDSYTIISEFLNKQK